MSRPLRSPFAGLLAVFLFSPVSAAAIAEVFIVDGAVRMEIEVRGLDARAAHFAAGDWLLRADGVPLQPELRKLAPRDAAGRDLPTGATGASDEAASLYAEIDYRLAGRPKTLSMRPPLPADPTEPQAAGIGLIAYHQGFPLNDFQKINAEETLELDWGAPWRSRFRNPDLTRRHGEPLAAFLYVDAFEVRKEIIVRLADLKEWFDLGLETKEVIAVDEQEKLKRKVADLLRPRSPVAIDGKAAEPVLDQIHFLRRTLRRVEVIDPPEALPAELATVGVTFVHALEHPPREATMRWDLFSPRIRRLSVRVSDETGTVERVVSPEEPVVTWKGSPAAPAFVELRPPPAPERLSIPLLSAACLLLLAGVAWHWRRRRLPARVAGPLVAVLTLLAIVFWPLERVAISIPGSSPAALSEADARAVVTGLLKNVYHAFDFHGEEIIYDTLGRSVAGDLLARVYLEMRLALELESQGGARVKVREVEVLETRTTPLAGATGFVSRTTWNVAGSVGHWGHIHERRNRYLAAFTVRPVGGAWKITDLEVVSEERVESEAR